MLLTTLILVILMLETGFMVILAHQSIIYACSNSLQQIMLQVVL